MRFKITPLNTAVLSAPQIMNGEWGQVISGPGWDDLPQRDGPRNRFTFLTNTRRPPTEFTSVLIEPKNGVDHALFTSLKKQDPSESTGTRVQWGIYPPSNMRAGFASYRLFLQHDLASAVLPIGTRRSRQLMELKETGPEGGRADFRWNISIYREPDRPYLMWGAEAQFGDLQDSPVAWSVRNSEFHVLTGIWANFQVFWRSHETEGQVILLVNGDTVLNITGRTMKNSGVYVWWPIKVYVGSNLESFGGVPIYQWVADPMFGWE